MTEEEKILGIVGTPDQMLDVLPEESRQFCKDTVCRIAGIYFGDHRAFPKSVCLVIKNALQSAFTVGFIEGNGSPLVVVHGKEQRDPLETSDN